MATHMDYETEVQMFRDGKLAGEPAFEKPKPIPMQLLPDQIDLAYNWVGKENMRHLCDNLKVVRQLCFWERVGHFEHQTPGCEECDKTRALIDKALIEVKQS